MAFSYIHFRFACVHHGVYTINAIAISPPQKIKRRHCPISPFPAKKRPEKKRFYFPLCVSELAIKSQKRRQQHSLSLSSSPLFFALKMNGREQTTSRGAIFRRRFPCIFERFFFSLLLFLCAEIEGGKGSAVNATFAVEIKWSAFFSIVKFSLKDL